MTEHAALVFRFPGGDFEIAMGVRLPALGSTITLEGKRWTVVEVSPGVQTVVSLEPAEPSIRAFGSEPRSRNYTPSTYIAPLSALTLLTPGHSASGSGKETAMSSQAGDQERKKAVSALEILSLVDGAGLKLVGELDLATVPRLTEALLAFASTDGVRLDLSALTFLDSSGVHAILALARSRRSDGSVVLLNPLPAVMRVLEIVDIHGHALIEVQSSGARPTAA